ncbi:hypothetical protein VNO77_31284 [Canavalia gladiata]|uniref:Uncharacterized protein n=1 Tax=Canavalia gladiata TaxID=3824 RepID=A0AAN9Q3X6_CANGL
MPPTAHVKSLLLPKEKETHRRPRITIIPPMCGLHKVSFSTSFHFDHPSSLWKQPLPHPAHNAPPSDHSDAPVSGAVVAASATLRSTSSWRGKKHRQFKEGTSPFDYCDIVTSIAHKSLQTPMGRYHLLLKRNSTKEARHDSKPWRR